MALSLPFSEIPFTGFDVPEVFCAELFLFPVAEFVLGFVVIVSIFLSFGVVVFVGDCI